MKENTKKSQTIYTGRVFTLTHDDIELDNGMTATRDVILHNGGAAIVPVDGEGNVYLVRQFRYPMRKELLELPAGKIDAGETPLDCAVRELREEAGLIAESMTPLGDLYVSPAYCTEVLYVYLAQGLTVTGQNLDEGEFLEVVKMPLAGAVRLVLEHQISDSKTQIGLLKAQAYLQKP